MGSTYDMLEMQGLEDVMVAFLGIYLVIMLIANIYSIVVYILHSLGLYSVAKRRGINHPWLAWIPVANVWMLGSISDHYQKVAKNKTTNRRKILLGLVIAMYAMLIVLVIAAVVFLVSTVNFAVNETAGTELIAPMLVVLLSDLVMLIVALVVLVFEYIAYYDLFASCNPNNATVFLVLGIFFSFLLPFFVFACRKKDLGMPVRQAPVQPEVPQYIPAPVVAEPKATEPETVQEFVAAESDFEPEA